MFEEVKKPTFLVLTISNPMDSNPQEFWGDMDNTHIVFVDECYLDMKKIHQMIDRKYLNLFVFAQRIP